MTDLFAFVSPKQRPGYGVSAARRQRFVDAFNRELEAHPNHAPGPRVLATRMGWKNRNLPGWASKLRIALLRDAGFRFNETFSRYVK